MSLALAMPFPISLAFTASLYGPAQPPSLKPPLVSSFLPPGACITPSNDTLLTTTTLRIGSPLRLGRLCVDSHLSYERASARSTRPGPVAISQQGGHSKAVILSAAKDRSIRQGHHARVILSGAKDRCPWRDLFGPPNS